MRVDDLLARLEGVTGNNGQWHARCPAHDDRQASLSVAVGRDGRILIYCWAGCSPDQVTAAVGMTTADLFADKGANPWGDGPLGQAPDSDLLPDPADLERWTVALLNDKTMIAAVFDAKGWRPDVLAALDIGLRGDRLAIPVRALDRTIVNLLRYSPTGSPAPKMIALRGRPRSPYYALVDDNAPIWIVEGETDAVSMACLGLDAIGAPGASAKPKTEWLDPVRGRQTIVCMDNDTAGRKAAIKWANAAQARGADSVRIVDLEGPVSYDVSDLLLEHRHDPGQARAHLYALAAAAPEHQVIDPRAVQTEPVPIPAPDNGVDESVETGTIISRPLSSFRPERLRMLWRDRIPVGRVGIIYGPPGQGKSTLLAVIVADVTAAGGRVLIASGDENDPSTTLLPRLAAAGADIGLVDLISTKAPKGDTELVLPRDMDALGRQMTGAAMLLIDPLSAHLGEEINAWQEQSVRAQVLAPLAFLARGTGCSIPYVSHMNKSNGTDPLSRISGSGGFGAAARFALLLGTHPDDIGLAPDERRLVLVHVKANESARQPAMVFRRRVTGVDVGDSGVAAVPVLELVDDLAQISPEQVLEHTDPDEAGAFSEALDYLRRELANGAKPSKRLLAQARERGDFSERTLRKAKRALKVASTRESDGWWWTLA